MSPFRALYGYPTPNITSYLQDHSKVHVMDSHIEKPRDTFQIIKENLHVAQSKVKQHAHQHCSERQFEVGIGYIYNSNCISNPISNKILWTLHDPSQDWSSSL